MAASDWIGIIHYTLSLR